MQSKSLPKHKPTSRQISLPFDQAFDVISLLQLGRARNDGDGVTGMLQSEMVTVAPCGVLGAA